jgi:ribosomal protein L37AE/L43A
MPRNKVQFQKGLSFTAFVRRYGREDLCHAELVAMRWPEGFVCPKCAGKTHSYSAARRIFQCSACRKQTSARAGTIFHKSSTPLTKWFLAMHLITSSKNDISSLELSRQIGVKWDTAWLIKQKLMEVMRARNSIYKLGGDVQIDDAYLGGERPAKAGKSGRGAEGKLPFVIAVETREGKPIHTQLRRVPDFTQKSLEAYAAANLEPGSWVISDGLSCFPGVKDAGMKHLPVVTGKGRPTHPFFKWVNTGLGNLKGSIVGTCRSIDSQHADRYLASYEWRYNRRFDLDKNIERLASVAAKIAPRPYRSIAAVRPAEGMLG